MMSTTAWEPLLGSTLTLLVSSVELYPEQPLVRLWGSLEEKRGEYQRLRADMQSAAPALPRGVDHGAFGDWYLMEMGDQWHRCRLLSPPGPELLSVFLLDQGRTAGHVSPKNLARCPEPFLRLAPELLCCVLANLAPADRHRWSPAAAEFLYSLRGQRLRGLVREVLPQQRLLVLEVPTLNRQMQELGLALAVPEKVFRQTCLPQLGYVRPAQVEPPVPRTTGPEPAVGLDYFYPLLQIGGVEPVLVTEVLEPVHIFCQLRSLSQEVLRLSDSMYEYYEVRQQGQALHGVLAPETPGQPCAARGADGRWHRALLRQVFADRDMPEVTHVDYGRRERVPRTYLRPLLAEYFRMPVVTYPCALFGVSDSSGCWSQKQINELRARLLGKPVNARIEYYNNNEHLYFVTLYSQDGQDLNSLFSMQAHRSEEVELCEGLMRRTQKEPTQPVPVLTQKKGTKTAEQRAIISKAGDACSFGRHSGSEVGAVEPAKVKSKPRSHSKNSCPVTIDPKETKSKPAQISAFTVRRELKINAFYDAVIDSIYDPSEFWLRAGEQESLQFSHLMTCLFHHYSQLSKVEKIIMQPQLGQICCVKFNAHYHRATVVAVQGKIVRVYCLDTGATEEVDWYDVKELEPQFKDVPPFAIQCCLADVVPQGNKWSQEAIDYFKMNVLNKGLVIHVLAKEDDKYVIEVLDESREGVRNISKIIAQAGFAIYQDFVPSPPASVQHTVKVTSKVKQVITKKVYTENHDAAERPEKLCDCRPLKRSDQSISSTVMLDHSTTAQSLAKQKTLPKPSVKDKPESGFQGQIFDIGSVFEVEVSHIETPGMFWCQIVRAHQELKALMNRIQAYCSDCALPYEWNNSACLAKYSEDGKWYRAVITNEVCMDGVHPEGIAYVDVAYVDFGNKESVPVSDLRSITGEFLQIKSQAFQCSLYNRIQPIGNNPFVWVDEAVASFEEFVNANHIELKCTIYAVASLHNEQFHVVDLTTPFHSVCQHLTDHGFAQPRHELDPSVRLCSYYYSTHDIKIGSEEVVFVTHVETPCEFYCQLEKNACTLEQLSSSVNTLGKTAKHLHNCKTVLGLCLAKYTDEQWYRGMLRGTIPSQEVIFVDFGNKEKVSQKDLCPVPDDAYDILIPPVQAIKCGLSDIPIDIAEQVAMWFEKAVLGNTLKAIVVAKEVDGKLLVELYNGTVQINAQIKEKIGMVCARDLKKSVPTAEKLKHMKMREDKILSTCATRAGEKKVLPECKEHIVKKSALSNKTEDHELSRRMLQDEPFTKKSRHPQVDGCDSLSVNSNKSLEGKFFYKFDSSGKQKLQVHFPPNINTDFVSVRSTQLKHTINSDLPQCKLHNLPHKTVAPALKMEVYISHISDPSDFYVQFVEDENALMTISEKLNEGSHKTESLQDNKLQTGDLISALFPEDRSWYRALLKDRLCDRLHVQYIDYGNTAIVNTSETKALPHDLLSIPALSIQCSLWGLESTSIWTPEVVGCFSEKTSDQLACEFVQLHGGKWDIRLLDAQGVIINDLINNLVRKSQSQETSCQNEIEFPDCMNILSKYVSPGLSSKVSDVGKKVYKWQTVEIGNTVKAYAVTVEGPDYFWCQCAETENIDFLARKVQEAGDRLDQKDGHTAFQSGEPCIVKYSEDEQWYRALIRCPAGDRWIVTFVDYGNEETVNGESVRSIPADLLTFPVQAFPCCLWGFDATGGFWTSEAVEAFNEIVVLDKLDVTGMDRRPNEALSEVPLSLVKLECNGKNLNNEMMCFWQQNPSELCTPGRERSDTENVVTPMALLPPIALSTDGGVLHVGSSVANNASQIVTRPQSFELTESACSSENSPKENISIQNTDLHSCSFQRVEDKSLFSPVSVEILPKKVSFDKLVKENSSDKWFVTGSESLSEEMTLFDVPNVTSVDMTKTMASPTYQLPKETVCIFGQLTQENTNPAQGVLDECLLRNGTDIYLGSESLHGKEAAVDELPLFLVLSEESACINKLVKENAKPLSDSPNTSLSERNSAWKYAGPDSHSLHGVNTVNDSPLIPINIIAKTSSSGNLPVEKEPNKLSPNTVCALHLLKESGHTFVVPPSESLQGGCSSFMQDALTSSVLIQKRRFLPVPETLFVEESEIRSCKSKIEPESEQRRVVVFEDAAGDFIRANNKSHVDLEDINKHSVAGGILEESKLGQEALDCCKERALEHNENGRVSQTETYRAEIQLEQSLYEEIFKSHTQDSLSSLKMSDDDDSRIGQLEEEDSLLELDTEVTTVTLDEEMLAVQMDSVAERRAASTRDTDEETKTDDDIILYVENQLTLTCRVPEDASEKKAIPDFTEVTTATSDEEMLAVQMDCVAESRAASTRDTPEETKADDDILYVENQLTHTCSVPEDAHEKKACPDFTEVTTVTLDEEMLAVQIDSVAEGRAASTRDTAEETKTDVGIILYVENQMTLTCSVPEDAYEKKASPDFTEMSSCSLNEGTLAVQDESFLQTGTSNSTDSYEALLFDLNEETPASQTDCNLENKVALDKETMIDRITLNVEAQVTSTTCFDPEDENGSPDFTDEQGMVKHTLSRVTDESTVMDVENQLTGACSVSEYANTAEFTEKQGFTLDKDLPGMFPESNLEIDVDSSTHTAEGTLPVNQVILSAENQMTLLCTCPNETYDKKENSSCLPREQGLILNEELPDISDANLERKITSPTHTVEVAESQIILTAENQMLLTCTCSEQAYEKTDSSSSLGGTAPENQVVLNPENEMTLSCTCPEEVFINKELSSHIAGLTLGEELPVILLDANPGSKMPSSTHIFEGAVPESQIDLNVQNQKSLLCTCPEKVCTTADTDTYPTYEKESGQESVVNMDCQT
ncbi:tudor domain-containing protein 6 isoform X2 [Pleurodeles waltl]|uniref:tudor domain-containing protein 6 isoform X2 n=1 Tax=Pleurodeles waltl TaxID=8319 RepID=UPI0037095431